VLKDPAAYIRCDAAVLYLRDSHLDRAAACVRDMARRLAHELKPGTPALTKPLATGIGLAQDPASGESFGLHRCGLLAEALVRAHAAGARSVDARLAFVESRFAESGLSLDRPYLNAGTSDPEIDLSVARRSQRRRSVGSDRPMDRGGLIAAARAIGDRLCAQALWHERRCSWVGVVSDPAADGEPAVNVCRALGPEIYSGASGVALFLAQLYAVAPSRRLRDTARGAIRQAMARCEGVRSELRLGLYSGWPGIALAATMVGQLLGDDECLDGAVTLAARLRDIVNVRRRSEFDLLSGSAGAIVALLFLRRALQRKGLGGLAVALGDRLLRSASNEGTTMSSSSWATVNFPARRNLTGYSHGTAGVAAALLELAQATGDERYRAGAERGFAYERRWFNPHKQNWPDFRETDGRRNEPDYASAWCHGAPGIALSRLRAWELVADDGCRAEGLTAAETTRTALRYALDAGATGYTLCHGLAGNADVLLEMQRLERRDADATLIHEVARRLRPHLDRPSLMVGQAGVGYFYLRVAAPSVPSMLLIRAAPA
jgi:lantibiotic modifying enzyme